MIAQLFREAPGVIATGVATLIAATCLAQDPKAEQKPFEKGRDVDPNAVVAKRPDPPPIPEYKLGRDLPTHPIPRGVTGPNWTPVDSTILPLDRAGIYVLEFAYRPLGMVEVELPGKGRRKIHYLYYRVVNRTGKPQRFVPQFDMVTPDGKQYHETVIPAAVKIVQNREDPSLSILGAVDIVGMIPPSTKEGIDDAVYGVVMWDDVDFKADAATIFVRGLSDAYQVVTPPDGAKPYTRFKAVRIDLIRPGDEFHPHQKEFRPSDPPFKWTYYP